MLLLEKGICAERYVSILRLVTWKKRVGVGTVKRAVER